MMTKAQTCLSKKGRTDTASCDGCLCRGACRRKALVSFAFATL